MATPSLHNRTVLALAEVVSACFNFAVNVGGEFQSRSRPDLFSDFLFEYEFPPPLVALARQLPAQHGAIKQFVLGLDIRAGQAPPLGCLLSDWDDAYPVSQAILRDLAAALLYLGGDRARVKPGSRLVERLEFALTDDGYCLHGSNLVVIERPPGRGLESQQGAAFSPELRSTAATRVLGLLYREYLRHGKIVTQYTPSPEDESDFGVPLKTIRGSIAWLASRGLVVQLGIDGTCRLTHSGVAHWEDQSALSEEGAIPREKNDMTNPDNSATAGQDSDTSKVFIIHGQNHDAATEMARFVRALGLGPIEWGQLRASLKGTPHIGDIVTEGMRRAHAVIALFTADEFAHLRPEYSEGKESTDLRRWQARPNVIFEAGIAYARDPDRVVLVRLGVVALFSDVAGIHYLSPTNDPAGDRNALRETLKAMGCPIREGTAWMKDGDFESCVLPEVGTTSPFPG